MKYTKTLIAVLAITTILSCAKEDEKVITPKPVIPTDSIKDIGKVDSVTLIYRKTTATYKTVVAKDGRVWLQQNLGSLRVAQTEDDQQSFGDVFQWGRWDDGHQLRSVPYDNAETALLVNNPTGISDINTHYYKNWWRNGDQNDEWSVPTPTEVTSTKGCDPCKALGSGWRLPTKEEWQTVVTKEEINGVTSGFKSNLKIPGSGGGRNQLTGDFEGPGNASFWTNEATGKMTSLGACAYAITFLSYQYSFSEYTSYSSGLTLRCIKSK